MPAYSSGTGDYVKIELCGYVHYNAGGFIGIGSEKTFEVEGQHDTSRGEYYFDIPEYMITSVESVDEFEYDTLFIGMAEGHPHPMVMQFVGSSDPESTPPWVLANTNKRVRFDPHAKDSEMLWSPKGI